ncbi:cytochrome o ubiquinol oxidase subunit I [Pseudoalteromonas sp. SR43-6]|jgi:cytochrome o ubiquinol oxidase subunit 1|uniref:Cytochrome bo(3) ubiquinol oxidase subunit 1 n=1 Tax=Pseudoalteromonas distincta TaxID=77608 RepID=A0ABT9GJC6_9GAMM|nr:MULTISPECIES: cytochrome o ubiquinol oxidase subunit I [Pseudoalteromonas]KHM44525.1 cytochrome o ubiquinol oxidase subunit I [Pseudoalteromonas elyakovii]KID40082.1 cytochrome o ubiquinol oxidase subunit I [Pseudoalteromonas distincta]MBB1278597.1 cytochrome o ubiquinol oxidase subunit I [Pseudoalteromonas sp. SR43-3]MBB1280747.1 cytochrome o ubiquinol oxidase subunit I [Pseudoalteromonas sp. SR41-1]MBB1289487.1 cytochrome o ubiquinol oxidase subunit I [Pseudoalteromonas sp. SR41-5]|tara:strand:+ start:238 stop:2226 length:1989 start_codon:yes stop_codon:yes gene_type:complete
MSLLGNLSLDAIPFHEPILVFTMSVIAIAGLIIAGLITKYKKWGVLWRDWITSVDHKRLGVMYILLALIMLFRGFSDAIMMRAQLALATSGAPGYLPPEHYDQIFTAHGVIMIIFMAMPFMIGLMNIVLPLQIGARDVAFPFLNNLSFWFTASGAILINLSLVFGEFAKTGWVAYPPLSELTFSPGVGVDYYIWALQISGLGTLLTAVNFLATVFKMRAPGMTLMKMPIFTWACTWANILIAASFPILTAVLAMLTLDRYLDFHFFTNELGGNAMMYINLFWAWGHPEVYILVLPAFGIFSEIISTFAGKRLFGYKSMVYASGAISILGFIVWLHHFFTMGSSANVNAFFGVMTMVIAVPTGVKLFNWLFTIYRGRLRISVPVLWTLGFMVTFTVGGMTGVLLAIPGADYVLHNSLFLIAHFHNTIIGGAVFGYLAGFVFWFPKAMGFKLNEKWGKASFWCWIIGFFVAFMPLYVLGFLGMTRRLNHTNNPDWNMWLYIAAGGAVIIMFGIISQVIQLYVSFRDREALDDTTGDPWNGHTLEWATSSPPQIYNFATIPHIDDIDAWTDMKEKGQAYQDKANYSPIHMPKNTSAGVLMAASLTVFCFAMIWHIWWLAVVGLVGGIAIFIKRCYTSDVDYYIQPDEIARIEAAYNSSGVKELKA